MVRRLTLWLVATTEGMYVTTYISIQTSTRSIMDGGARLSLTEPRDSTEFLVSPLPRKRKRFLRRRDGRRRGSMQPPQRELLSPLFQGSPSAAAEGQWTRPPWMSARDERDLDALLMRGSYYDRLRVHISFSTSSRRR